VKVPGFLLRLSERLTTHILVRVSGVLTIIGLALMVWSMLQPTPLPVMLAMSLGQVIGTSAFALYLFVVVRDIQRHRRAKRESLKEIKP
jgi:hypothetical protein